jgi:hypothetical protein
MKFQLTLLLCIFTCLATGQNVTLEKKLDNTVELSDDYFILMHPAIRYERVFDDHVLRMEENEIQLFDAGFNKVWQVNLEKTKSVGGQNYLSFATGEEYIYIINFGAAFKSGNAESRLTSISKSGESKTVMLSDQIELRGVTGMHVANDNLYLFYSRTTGAPTPYSNIEIFTSAIAFDPQLNQKGSVFEFPAYAPDGKHNLIWQFDGVHDDQLLVTSCYWMNEKGKCASSHDDGYEPYQAVIQLDYDNNDVVNETNKISMADFLAQKGIYSMLKYDTEKFKIVVSGQTLTQYRKGGYVTSLTLNKPGSEAVSVYDKFYELIGKGNSAVKPVMYFTDAISDPVHGGITLVIQCVNNYALNFNANLELVNMYEFDASYYTSNNMTYCSSFIYGISKVKETFGTAATKDSGNAFDLAMSLNKKCQFSVLNFDTFQVLFTDDKVSGETIAYKMQ